MSVFNYRVFYNYYFTIGRWVIYTSVSWEKGTYKPFDRSGAACGGSMGEITRMHDNSVAIAGELRFFYRFLSRSYIITYKCARRLLVRTL